MGAVFLCQGILSISVSGRSFSSEWSEVPSWHRTSVAHPPRKRSRNPMPKPFFLPSPARPPGFAPGWSSPLCVCSARPPCLGFTVFLLLGDHAPLLLVLGQADENFLRHLGSWRKRIGSRIPCWTTEAVSSSRAWGSRYLRGWLGSDWSSARGTG